jgi:hypothetical protein
MLLVFSFFSLVCLGMSPWFCFFLRVYCVFLLCGRLCRIRSLLQCYWDDCELWTAKNLGGTYSDIFQSLKLSDLRMTSSCICRLYDEYKPEVQCAICVLIAKLRAVQVSSLPPISLRWRSLALKRHDVSPVYVMELNLHSFLTLTLN